MANLFCKDCGWSGDAESAINGDVFFQDGTRDVFTLCPKCRDCSSGLARIRNADIRVCLRCNWRGPREDLALVKITVDGFSVKVRTCPTCRIPMSTLGAS